MSKKLELVLNSEGLFCVRLKSKTQFMAAGLTHLKDELKARGIVSVYSPDLKREYELSEL